MEWPHWDACYRLADGPSYAFAVGQWDHQIFDEKTGDFSRHARWSEHGPQGGADFPRYAGQLILNWADALARPASGGRPRRDELPQAIAVLVGRMEETLGQSPIGQLAAHRGAHYGWTSSNLELARCLHQATVVAPSDALSDDLRGRMRRLVMAAADRYLESDPDPAAEQAPEAFAEAIEFLLREHAIPTQRVPL